MTLFVFAELPLRTYQQTEPILRTNVGSCPQLSDNADILGSRTTFSSVGLFPSLFVGYDGSSAENLKIVRSKLLCEAIGAEKNTVSSVSFLVEYIMENDQSNNRLAQLVVDCAPNPHGPGSHSFYPAPHPGSTGSALNTARVANGVTIVTRSVDISANFSTEPQSICAQCETSDGIFTDRVTRCTGKLTIT